MAVLYIAEFTRPTSMVGTLGNNALPQPNVTDQTVAIGAASAQSAAFNARTHAILISSDIACSIVIGDDPEATTSNFRLPANTIPPPLAVVPGQKIAVIQN